MRQKVRKRLHVALLLFLVLAFYGGPMLWFWIRSGA